MQTPSPADDSSRTLRELVRSGRFPDALAVFRAREADGDPLRPDERLLAATAAMRLGDVQIAEALSREALRGFRSRGDRDGRMRSLNLLGVIAFERGRLDEAEAAFGEALTLARQLADTQLAAHVSNNLGSLCHLRGQADQALGLYREALASHSRLGDRRGAAESWHNLALALRQKGWWREAEDAIAEAVRHAEVLGDPALLALALTGRAELQIDRGQFALADQALARADRLAAEARDAVGQGELRRIRALGALRRGDLPLALAEAEAAYAAGQAFDVALLRADAAAVLCLVLRRLGRVDEAEWRRREAVERYLALGADGLSARLEREWSEED